MISTASRYIAFFVLAVFVAGCSAISTLQEASRPLEIYELQTPDVEPTATGRSSTEVVIEEPVASGALATERIMIQPSPLQAQYLPGVRWADPAPVMLQTLLVRSLTQTGALGSVGRRPIGSRADLSVLSELTDFQAEAAESGSGATVRLRLIVRIVRESDASVIATRTFVVIEQAGATDVETIVATFDRASTRLLSEVVPWLLAVSRRV